MLSLKNYETRFPNMNSEYFNKLNTKDQEQYLKLYQKYHNLVLNYLSEKLSLASYDKTLQNNSDKFIPVKKEDMDMYQYLCSDKLRYFYLRNNFYIERLSEEELEYLKNIDGKSKENEFIIKTLKKVISEYQDGRRVSLCFGSDSLKYFKPNGSIVIGVRYDEFSDKIPDDENWLDTYTNIKGELEFILDAFSFNNKGLNDMPISVLTYNEYNTIKLKDEEEISNTKGNEIIKDKSNTEKSDEAGVKEEKSRNDNINFY